MGENPKKIVSKTRDIRLRQISISMEACNALFQQVLKINDSGKIKFTDGRKAYLRAFAEPYFDNKGDGYPMCVVDFVMPDGHLEFEIKLTGYGGTPAFFAHKGDPCIYCKTPFDQIKSGPCPARVALIDKENKGGNDDGKTTEMREQEPECKDTFCLTCGMKNCPKVEWCPRAELEED